MRQLFTHGLNAEAQKETDIGTIPKSWDLRPLESAREFLQDGTSGVRVYQQGQPRYSTTSRTSPVAR